MGSLCLIMILAIMLQTSKAYSKTPKLTFVNTTAKLPSPRISPTVVFDGNDKIYIMGGYGPISYGPGPLDSILEYSITTNEVNEVGKFPQAIYGGTAYWDGVNVVHFGGKIDSRTGLKNIYKYRPGDSVVRFAGSMEFENYDSCLANHYGSILILGGENNGNMVTSYGKNKPTLLKNQRLPIEVSSAACIQKIDTSSYDAKDTVYIFGGKNNGNLNTIIKYDVGSGESIILEKTLPYSANFLSAIYTGKDVFIVGSDNLNNTGLLHFTTPYLKSYDDRNDYYHLEEIVVDNFPKKLQNVGLVYAEKIDRYSASFQRIYIFGGKDENNQFLDTISYLDVE